MKALLERDMLPHERRGPRPPAALVDWFCSVLQLNEDGRDVLRAAGSWSDFLFLLFRNEDVAEKIFQKWLVDTVQRELAARAAAASATPPATDGRPMAETSAAVEDSGPKAAPSVDKIVPTSTQIPAPAAAPPEPADAVAAPASAPAAALEEAEVEALIHLTLGRKPKDAHLQSFVGKPPLVLLRSVLHSGEFDERILATLIERRRLPLDMTSPRPSEALKTWLLAHLPLSGVAEAALAAVHSWRGMLVTLLNDHGIRRHVFDADRPGPKMRYLLSRIDAAQALYAQPGPVLMARGLRLDRADWTVSGHVDALEGEGAQLRLQMEARSKLELLAALPPPGGGRPDFVLTLPESCRNSEDWFARIDVLRDGKVISVAPGTFRFTARDPGGRAAAAVPARKAVPVAAPQPAAPPALRVRQDGLLLLAENLPPAALPVTLQLDGQDAVPAVPHPGPADQALFLLPAAAADGAGHRLQLLDAARRPLWSAAAATVSATPPRMVELRQHAVSGYELTEGLAAPARFVLKVDGEFLAASAGRAPEALPLLAGLQARNGFRFELPPRLLDGQPHLLEIFAELGPEAERPIGQLELCYAAEDFRRELAAAQTPAALQALLERMAEAGRLDLLQAFLDERRVLVGPVETLALLVRAFVRRPLEAARHPLRQHYDKLWKDAAGSAGSVDKLLLRLADALQRAIDPTERRVVHETALKDVLLDICMTVWQRDQGEPETATQLARLLLGLNRPAMAELVLDRALVAAPGSHLLLSLLARLRTQQGRHEEALTLVRAALKTKPGHADAEALQAILLQARGDHAGSLGAATRGRGLAQRSAGGKIDARLARLAFPQNWFHWSLQAFAAQPNAEFTGRLNRAIALQGGELPAAERSFAVLYLPPRQRDPRCRDDFLSYGPDCSLVARMEDNYLGGAPSIGTWTLFLREDRALAPAVLQEVLQARRPAVDVVRILGPLTGGEAEPRPLMGLLLRSCHIEHLGRLSLDEADAYLSGVLRSITVFGQI
ncbi:hypothetical protein [Pseudoroseomonas cervicalis]|uniref:hypothetical protein n=1 Tax=Teichococcus cervicalis TaxID=204525 RepID=UPI0027D864CA|nr:hypothetical protein [Pseudoroseomonas cervicalis]